MTEKHTAESSPDGLKRLLKMESGDSRALAANLQDNPICTVSYYPDVPCLLVKWKRYATSTQLRYIHECLIQLIKEHGVSKILGDDTDLASIAAVDQHWIARDWIPRAMAAGLKTVVSIKPRAYFGQTSVNRILSFLPAGLAVRSFESFEEGRSWLRNAYQPGTYRIVYQRFKGAEPINTFPFWCQEPSIGYFRQVARLALRAFWKVEDGSLEPVIPRQPLPELIVVEGDSGDEICRWSLEDEMLELRETPRGV
jgi:hypothetical protein